MENKNNIQDELKNIAPILSKLERKNNFSVPKDYFEVLPEVISNKNLNNKSLYFSFDKLSWRILVPITAIFALVFYVMNNDSNSTQNELTNEQLSELIVDENYIEIDDYLVYETYAEIIEESDNSETSEAEEYIDYLMDNNININSIIEEL